MKILVIDDDKSMLLSLAKVLKDAGYDVFDTSNGVEALHIISHQNIDMVISDVVMPCISGFTIATMLKKFYFSNIPVLLMSSSLHETTLLDSHGIKAADFFSKPIDFERLLKRIEKYARNMEMA